MNESNRLTRAVLAGFCGSVVSVFVAILAYFVAVWLSGLNLAPRNGALGPWYEVEAWLRALTNNGLVDYAHNQVYGAFGMHLLIGMIWAVVYAGLAEPWLPGRGWQKGLLFSLGPWILSLVVFLPLVGAGFFGLALGAGPFPAVGNLILHLFYGGAMGLVYSPAQQRLMEGLGESRRDRAEIRSLRHAETSAAKGLLLGLVVGFLLGIVTTTIGAVFHTYGVLGLPDGWYLMSTALMGGALGALIGSLVGLPSPPRAPRAPRVHGR